MNAMKSVIARLNAITQTPIVFIVDSKRDSQIDAFIEGQIKRVGIETYQHSQKLTREDAIKVARIFAEHENIPVENLVVRERLPKTKPMPVLHNRRTNDVRKTNDAALTLVKKEDDKQPLASAAQDLHDKETGKQAEKVEAKSTASNPEGAVVKPQDKAVRTKRAYNKKTDKELSKRSAAAMRRYEAEIRQAAAKSPTIQASVQAAAEVPSATTGELTEEQLAKALKLARVMVLAGLV